MKPEDRPTSMVSFPLTIVGVLFLAGGGMMLTGTPPNFIGSIGAVGIGLALIGLAGINTRLAEVIHELRLIRAAAERVP
ncbi:MAG TPA: hypothetical protein VD995_03255 [Azospirillum sp.]|nr:hypothetical protein [Azospirillum sp.]